MLKSLDQPTSSPVITAYPGYGHHANANRRSDWKIRLSGVVYQIPDEFSIRKRMMIGVLRNVMKVPPDALNCELFWNRIAPFLADAQHRRQIVVRMGGEEFKLDRKTGRNGRFESWLRVPASLIEDLQEVHEGVSRIRYEVSTELPDTEPVQSEAYLHHREGLCVISDIDDTIKQTAVTNRRELLANTFLRDFEDVPGMRRVYERWSRMGANFHYVSSSPWQLFQSLRQMQCDKGFPMGALHLRNFRIRDQILNRVMVIRRHGKATAIRSLLKNLPGRKFIMVGDSGEKDPEIYAKICRQFPKRILALFIRELPERPMNKERKTKFKALPHVPVHLFRDPDELAESAQPVLERFNQDAAANATAEQANPVYC